jgi:hypothetical protein
LFPKYKNSREEQFPKDGGMVFSNMLENRDKYSNFCNNPNSTGILPVKKLPEKSMYDTSVQLLRVGGMRPCSELNLRLR